MVALADFHPALADLAGADLRALSVAWARVTPSILLVPAFGLRAVAAPTRLALALSLAVCLAPAVRPVGESSLPWLLLVLRELARGLPVAVTAAVALWVATMAGNLADNLRGVHRPEPMPNVEPGATPLGVLFSLLAAIAFLESGGPSRIVKRLAAPDLTILAPVERVALDLVLGVELALAVLAPVIVAAIVFDLAAALVHRALQPALVGSLLAPLRSMALLAIVALALDRVAEVVALHAASRP